MAVEPVVVAGHEVGVPSSPWVIAELSGNHNGSLDRALALVDAAAAAGAHAIKLQTYTADTLTIAHDGPGFRLEGGLWSGRTLHDLYQEAHTPWEWHRPLFERARQRGVTMFSSPFDPTAIELLESLDCPAYKVASPEVVDLPLIRLMASTGKPLVMSTGMASLREIAEAVDAARDAGCDQLVLLHCVSGYPTPPEDVRLRTMHHLEQAFGVPVGLSDHTLGTAVSIAASALGAAALERHVTLRRDDGGVDSAFSLEPEELAALVAGAATARAAAAGEPTFELAPSERGSLGFRRSLYVVRDVPAGAELTPEVVRSIRPSHGLPPRCLPLVLGRTATRDLARGEPLDWTMVGGPT